MKIKENVLALKREIEELKTEYQITHAIKICAATKYAGPLEMRELLACGISDFGENRADAFLEKYAGLSEEKITWHFIGTLQSNKVKKVINHISYLHSLDRESLAAEINKYRTTPLDCFVQVNCSQEVSKHGLKTEEVLSFIYKLQKYDKIRIIGLMTMAEYTDDDATLIQTFQTLRLLRDKVRALKLHYAPCTELSMGMSNDYPLAIKEGATVIRIGSRLFK